MRFLVPDTNSSAGEAKGHAGIGLGFGLGEAGAATRTTIRLSTMSSSFVYMTNAQCERALGVSALMQRLETAMKSYSSGDISMPVRASLALPQSGAEAFFLLMPCYSAADGGLACKLVGVFPDNTKFEKPTLIVYVLLIDSKTGQIQAIMQGDEITKRRTAATSALSAHWLFCGDQPKVLGVLGSGQQARAHIHALLAVYPSIERINVWNLRHSSAKKMQEELMSTLPVNTSLKVSASVNECVKDADLVVTATFASDPVLKKNNIVKEDVHIMAVGAARPNQAELEPALLKSARVVVDSLMGATKESGDVIKSGCNIDAELGQIIALNEKPTGGLTVYKSLGLAVQDLVSAQMIWDESTKWKESDFEPLPVPVINRDEVAKAIKSIAPSSPTPVTERSESTSLSGLSGTSLEATFTATQLGSELLVCDVRTRLGGANAKAGAGGCDYAMVYRAQTGELLALVEASGLRGLSAGAREAVLLRLLSERGIATRITEACVKKGTLDYYKYAKLQD